MIGPIEVRYPGTLAEAEERMMRDDLRRVFGQHFGLEPESIEVVFVDSDSEHYEITVRLPKQTADDPGLRDKLRTIDHTLKSLWRRRNLKLHAAGPLVGPIEVRHSAQISPEEQAGIEYFTRRLFALQFGEQAGLSPDDIEVKLVRVPSTGPRELTFVADLAAMLDLGIGEMMYGESLRTIYSRLVEFLPGWEVSMEVEGG